MRRRSGQTARPARCGVRARQPARCSACPARGADAPIPGAAPQGRALGGAAVSAHPESTCDQDATACVERDPGPHCTAEARNAPPLVARCRGRLGVRGRGVRLHRRLAAANGWASDRRSAERQPGARAALLVSWTTKQSAARRVSVRILSHPDMPPGTSWQGWLVTGRDAAPVSLGLIGAEPHQVLELGPAAVRALPSTTAIGISVEPKGGSTTGRPGGAFLFQGPTLRVDG
jgi:hypothetical protein